MKTRRETDSLGAVEVPETAYYGAQTQRAKENFTISALRLQPAFIRSLALVKKCAARVNAVLGLVDQDRAEAIARAAEEVMEGGLEAHFIVDVFQTGSGTSTHMNMNEVLAARANEILGESRRTKGRVHPNDHVNRCQSSNDVIPTTLHIAAAHKFQNELAPALARLEAALDQKAGEFADIQKIGRTHLQDALIMSLGDEFSGYGRQMALSRKRLQSVQQRLCFLALGGTAVGTGAAAHPGFAPGVIRMISEATGIAFSEAPNHFEAQGACDAAVEAGAGLKTIAVSLSKIANDIRWLASGPRCGLGEIRLPELQPGSSIMPGKVNPVIPEAVIQACAQVIANDAAITLGGQGGCLELNTMLPLVAYNLLQAAELLAGAAEAMADKCVPGIRANRQKCAENIEKSLALATSLAAHIGYDSAAALARRAHASGRTIEEVALEENLMAPEKLRRVLYGASGA